MARNYDVLSSRVVVLLMQGMFFTKSGTVGIVNEEVGTKGWFQGGKMQNFVACLFLMLDGDPTVQTTTDFWGSTYTSHYDQECLVHDHCSAHLRMRIVLVECNEFLKVLYMWDQKTSLYMWPSLVSKSDFSSGKNKLCRNVTHGVTCYNSSNTFVIPSAFYA
jgi:hypothetical protein